MTKSSNELSEDPSAARIEEEEHVTFELEIIEAGELYDTDQDQDQEDELLQFDSAVTIQEGTREMTTCQKLCISCTSLIVLIFLCFLVGYCLYLYYYQSSSSPSLVFSSSSSSSSSASSVISTTVGALDLAKSFSIS